MKSYKPPPGKRTDPLLQRLLRSAGNTSRKIDLIQDDLLKLAMVSYLVLAIAFITIIDYLRPPTLVGVIAITSLAFVFTAYSVGRIMRRFPSLRSYQFGRSGEMLVSQLLHRERDKEWRIFDDVQMGSHNLDHVIVAPQGVFCIETEARKNRKNKMLPATYNGTTLSIGDECRLSQPHRQHPLASRATRENLHKYLAGRLRDQCPLKSVLVFPRSYVTNTVHNKPEDLLWVMNPEQLPPAIRKLEPIMSAEQRAAVCQALGQRDRVLSA